MPPKNRAIVCLAVFIIYGKIIMEINIYEVAGGGQGNSLYS
jgi:hypothetical protein